MGFIVSGLITKYSNILRIIIAGRVDYIKDQFMQRIQKASGEQFDSAKADGIFEQLLNADPSKAKMYVGWLCNLYISGVQKWKNDEGQVVVKNTQNSRLLEDLPKATQYLQAFDKMRNRLPDDKKDIMKYPDLPSLFNEVKQGIEQPDAMKSNREQNMKSSGEVDKILSTEAKKVFDDGKWEVWNPESHKASCLLGRGTEWCTSWEDSARKQQSEEYYNKYKSEGELYIFINKQNPQEKYQYHQESNQFMDVNDSEVKKFTWLLKDPELLKFTQPLLTSEQKETVKMNKKYLNMTSEQKMQLVNGDDEKAIINLLTYGEIRNADADGNPLDEVEIGNRILDRFLGDKS